MNDPLGVGCVLLPDPDHLAMMKRIIEEKVDFFEISPETFWMPGPQPLAGYYEVLCTIVERSKRPVVGHGLDLSPAGVLAPESEVERFESWLRMIRQEHARFNYRWYSEHLGYAAAGGWVAELPLPMPMTDEAIGAVATRFARLREIVPEVAFENQTWYYHLGDVRREPEFLNRICREAKCSLLLDIHNAYSQCLNLGFDLDDYLGRLELDRVIEIHISGGSESDAAWLPSGRVFRIDTHDNPVPEPVWAALAKWLPKCPNVRGVVLERLDGTLKPDQVPAFEAEFDRLREVWRAGRR